MFLFITFSVQFHTKKFAAQAIKSDFIAFYACALKFRLCPNLTVDNSIGKT